MSDEHRDRLKDLNDLVLKCYKLREANLKLMQRETMLMEALEKIDKESRIQANGFAYNIRKITTKVLERVK